MDGCKFHLMEELTNLGSKSIILKILIICDHGAEMELILTNHVAKMILFWCRGSPR